GAADRERAGAHPRVGAQDRIRDPDRRVGRPRVGAGDGHAAVLPRPRISIARVPGGARRRVVAVELVGDLARPEPEDEEQGEQDRRAAAQQTRPRTIAAAPPGTGTTAAAVAGLSFTMK